MVQEVEKLPDALKNRPLAEAHRQEGIITLLGVIREIRQAVGDSGQLTHAQLVTYIANIHKDFIRRVAR